MPLWKQVVLVAGILGVSGAFAPMLEIKQGRVAIELSARRLSFGFDREYNLVDHNLPRLAEKYLPSSIRSTRDDVRLVAQAARWAALAYVPAALMVLLGLSGLLRRRFGRLSGLLAVLCGLGSLGAWLGLHFGIPLALKEAELQHTDVSLLFGAHLLLLVGAAGVLAGLGALARPDPARPSSSAAHPPGLSPPPGPPPPGFPPPPMPPPPAMPPPASA